MTVNRYAFLLTTPVVVVYWLAYFVVLRVGPSCHDDSEANIQEDPAPPSLQDDTGNTHPTAKLAPSVRGSTTAQNSTYRLDDDPLG